METLIFGNPLDGWPTLAASIMLFSGVQLMSSHLIDADGRGLTVGAFSGLFVISLLLMALLRSVRIGLLSMIPNIFPAVSFIFLFPVKFNRGRNASPSLSRIKLKITLHFITVIIQRNIARSSRQINIIFRSLGKINFYITRSG